MGRKKANRAPIPDEEDFVINYTTKYHSNKSPQKIPCDIKLATTKKRLPLWKQAVANYSPESEWIDIASGIQRKNRQSDLKLV